MIERLPEFNEKFQVHAVYPTIHQDNLVKMNVDQIMAYDQRKLKSIYSFITRNSRLSQKYLKY